MSTPTNETKLVMNLMLSPSRFPVVLEKTLLKETLEEMCRKRLGIACIVNEEKYLKGIITDGDFRRKLLKVQKPLSAFFVDDAFDHAIHNPVTVNPDQTLLHAVQLMEEKQIWDLPVVNLSGILVGLLHLHPVVQNLLGERQ